MKYIMKANGWLQRRLHRTDQNGVAILQQAVNYGYQRCPSRTVRPGLWTCFDYQDPAAYRTRPTGYSYVVQRVPLLLS